MTDFLPVGDEKEDEVLDRGIESESDDSEEGDYRFRSGIEAQEWGREDAGAAEEDEGAMNLDCGGHPNDFR